MKRKQVAPPATAATPTARKRVKHAHASPSKTEHPHGEVDYEREYRVRAIIDEKGSRFLIDWEPDEETGQVYQPTWEPKTNANEEAKAEWYRQKAEDRAAALPLGKPAAGAAKKRGRRRTPKAKPQWHPPTSWDRSGDTQTGAASSPPRPDRKKPEVIESPDKQATSDAELELEEAAASPLLEPVVEVSDPPSSFQAGAYQKFGSSSSQSAATASNPGGSNSTVYQSQTVPVNFGERSARVIPDSQTLVDLYSAAPAVTEAEERETPTCPAAANGSDQLEAASSAVSAAEPSSQVLPASSGPGPVQRVDHPPAASRAQAAVSTSVSAQDESVLDVPQSAVGIVPESCIRVEPTVRTHEGAASQSPSHVPRTDSGDPVSSAPQSLERIEQDSERSQAVLAATSIDSGDLVSSSQQSLERIEQDTEHSQAVVAAPRTASGDPVSTGPHSSEPIEQDSDHSQAVVVAPGTDSGDPVSSDPQSSERIEQDTEHSQAVVPGPSTTPREKNSQAAADNSQPTSPVSEAVPSITASRSHFELEVLNGIGSVVREGTASPTRPDTQKATVPRSIFHSQLARPGTSASQVSPLIRRNLQPYFSGVRASSLPASHSSALQSSSSIPSVPSRFAVTIGESAPPRPVAPSSEMSYAWQGSRRAMDASQASMKSTPRLIDTLNAIREQSRKASTQPSPQAVSQSSIQSPAFLTQAPRLVSNPIAEEQYRRSPSAVPAMEPVAEISQEEQNTSERYPTLFPQNEANGNLQRIKSMAEGVTLSRQQSKVPSPSLLTHLVPVGLVGQQRDECSSLPSYTPSREILDRFLTTENPDSKLIAAIERLVQRLRHVALHMDLQNDETATQYDVGLRTQVDWDLSCSGKFRFLKALFDDLRDQTVHVAIVMRPGRIMGILEAFLRDISVPHRRLADIATSSLQSGTQGLMVTLVSTKDEVGDVQPSPADVLIAIEPTVDEECLPIRALMQRGAREAIRLTLVARCTIEHVEQSISSALAPLTRLRALVKGLRQYQTEAGRLDVGQKSAEDAARLIANYIIAEEHTEWPIEELEPLENLDSQTESELEPLQSRNVGSDSNKRSLGLDEPTGSADMQKRPRLGGNTMDHAFELPTTINPQNLEVTCISGSSAAPSQHAAPTGGDDAIEHRPLTDAERRLQRMLKEAQDRLEEHVKALSELQFRFEEQRIELVGMTNERNSQAVMAQTATGRMTESMNNSSKLKAERTELVRQLEQANAKLLDHSVPGRRDFEALRLRVEQAEKEKRTLQEKLKSAEENIEFFRTAYQDSSQSAQNLASQNTELDNEVVMLRNKATGEQAKLRQLGYNEHTKMLRSENKKLKATLRNFEAANKFKDEEIARLKEAGRGRIGTRGSSIPRTPRLGSPAKMDGLKGRGSRPGSPAPGEPKGKGALHPLSRVD